MHFSDLELYRYSMPKPIEGVVTVGWLSKNSSFATGKVDAEFIDSLARLLSTNRVNQMRGYHVCELCMATPLFCTDKSGRMIRLGSAEVWLPSRDGAIVFAAPDMIYHYVTHHHYLPPISFVEAVCFYNPDSWNATIECEKRLNDAVRPTPV